MISSIFAFILFLGMLLPWLLKQNRKLSIYFIGSIPMLLAAYFVLVSGVRFPLYELIGSQDPVLGISLALGLRELLWLVLTMILISLHFIIYRKQFLNLSLTSLVLYLFSFFAVCGIIFTRDIFNLFVMIEMFSLSMLGLILATKTHLNALKAFQYLLLNSIAAALFLIGVALIYKHTGVLNIDVLLSMPARHSIPGSPMAFILSAIALKLMLFPLNAWAKNLIGRTGGIDSAYITVMMPMVFIFDLQKLSGLISASSVALLSALAASTLLFYLFRLIRPDRHWRADLVFAANALFVLGFSLHFYLDSYHLLLISALLSSGLKLVLLAPAKDIEAAEELSARAFELNLNDSILALMIVLVALFVV